MGLSNILEYRTAESLFLQRIQQTFRLLALPKIRETGQPQSYRQHPHIATKSCQPHIPSNWITQSQPVGPPSLRHRLPIPFPPAEQRKAGGGLSARTVWGPAGTEFHSRPARRSSAGEPAGPGV